VVATASTPQANTAYPAALIYCVLYNTISTNAIAYIPIDKSSILRYFLINGRRFTHEEAIRVQKKDIPVVVRFEESDDICNTKEGYVS